MSEEKTYGVECKTESCNTEIVLGTYLRNPTNAGDLVSFVVVKKAGAVKCPKCGKEHEYDQPDIVELS